jgi:hypothetical protein
LFSVVQLERSSDFATLQGILGMLHPLVRPLGFFSCFRTVHEIDTVGFYLIPVASYDGLLPIGVMMEATNGLARSRSA